MKIYKHRKINVFLKDDLLNICLKYTPDILSVSVVINNFKGALNLRHWIAHGRCWHPKLGGQYDAITVYNIAYNLLTKLNLKYNII